MKLLWIALAIALAIALSGCATAPSGAPSAAAEDAPATRGDANDPRAPRALAERYDRACAQQRGRDAAALLAPSAVRFYETTRIRALNATRADLQALPFFAQLQAVSVRAVYPASALEGWTGAELFAAFVDEGYIKGDTASSGLTPTDAILEGDRARIPFAFEGRPTRLFMTAHWVDGRWLIDPLPAMRLLSRQLHAKLASKQVTAQSFLTDLALRLSDGRVTDPWKPPVR